MRSSGGHSGEHSGGHVGGPPTHPNRHGHATHPPQKLESANNRRAVWAGFIVAGIGYMVLSGQQPAGWGVGLWAALALLLVPALAGVAVNRLQSVERTPRQAFFAGMKAAGWAMFFYASITLIVVANRLGSADGGGQRFLAGSLVMLVNSIIAGSAAGLVNVALIRVLARRHEDGPAS